VFHVKNLRIYDPNAIDFDHSIHLPEIELRDAQWEIQELLSHRKVGKQNQFLVWWKNHNPLLASSFVSEAELRRDASELLEV
jgi:hypothetical protein